MVYVVTVKPSARRTSAPVGRWVQDEGARRTFESKPLAREWARTVSGPRARVWIQDAAPHDRSDADGYLVGGGPQRRSRGGQHRSSASGDRQARLGEA